MSSINLDSQDLVFVRYQSFVPTPTKSSEEPCEFVDNTAKRCIPFKQASGLGWYLFPPFDARIIWKGEREFEVETTDPFAEKLWLEVMFELLGFRTPWWCSKIPGVFQVDPGFIVISKPNLKVLLTGPMNRPHRGYWVHSGMLDSDWFKAPTTINLQVWRKNSPFELNRAQPIAQLVPISSAHFNLRCECDAYKIGNTPDVLYYWQQYVSETHKRVPHNPHLLTRAVKGVYARKKRAAEEVQKRSDDPSLA